MTDKELEVINAIMAKIPYNDPIDTITFFRAHLYGTPYGNDGTALQKQDALTAEKIRSFLLDNDYIECTSPHSPIDKLIARGKKANELGGHQAYLAWEQREAKKKNRQEIPKRYWLAYEACKWFILLIAGALISHYILEPMWKAKVNSPVTAPVVAPTNPAAKGATPKVIKHINIDSAWKAAQQPRSPIQ